MNWQEYVIIFLVLFVAFLIWLLVWLWKEKWGLEDELVNSEYSRYHEVSNAVARYDEKSIECDRAHRMIEVLLDKIPNDPSKEPVYVSTVINSSGVSQNTTYKTTSRQLKRQPVKIKERT